LRHGIDSAFGVRSSEMDDLSMPHLNKDIIMPGLDRLRAEFALELGLSDSCFRFDFWAPWTSLRYKRFLRE